METLFQVFDNDRPADCFNHEVHKSWEQSKFKTFDEALEYARNWLGYPEGDIPPLELNVPWDYSGYGDKIEIREVKT